MTMFFDNSSHDWSVLLDELKQKEGIPSDAKLAAELGVTGSYICSVRKGRKRLSVELARVVLSRLGKSFEAELMERLFVPAKVQLITKDLAAIRKFVIERARGTCQLCGCVAPFIDSDGLPYLEIHPVIPLRKGGTNLPDNLVALCPNCNRKIEVSRDLADVNKLQKIIAAYK